MYQSQGQYIICRNFNARCGNEPDYIEGVNEHIERTIVDYKKNHYGDLLIDFLINPRKPKHRNNATKNYFS